MRLALGPVGDKLLVLWCVYVCVCVCVWRGKGEGRNEWGDWGGGTGVWMRGNGRNGGSSYVDRWGVEHNCNVCGGVPMYIHVCSLLA